jgi:hypothetical protein
MIGMTRQAMRKGVAVGFKPDAPRVFYLRQGYRLLSAVDTTGSFLAGYIRTVGFFPRPVEEFLISSSLRSFWEAGTKRKIGETGYDLCRLALAKRIRELEGSPIKSSAELVPDLFSADPIDHFSGKPFRMDSTGRFFYSLGPDMDDDRGLVRYDSANGVVSNGDIFTARPAEQKQ